MSESEYILDTDLESFDIDVIAASAEHPVLVDYWADWCGPCITIAPILEKVIPEYEGRITLVRLEVDEGDNMKLAGQYQVRGFPTLILYQNGEETARFSGAKPTGFIHDFIEKHTQLTVLSSAS